MKVLVCGYGQMGQAVSQFLYELGCQVTAFDKNDVPCKQFITLVKGPDFRELTDGVDGVVSCLPYHQTFEVAHHCIHHNIPYTDLGGSVPVSKKINEYAKIHSGKVFTDLGLAPGLVNILSCYFIKKSKHQFDTVHMGVGGIPKVYLPEDPLNYNITWSVDGLYNEYKDDCLILEDGNIKTVKALSGYSTTDCNVGGEILPIEVFRTSGGMAHSIEEMKELGIKNCEYKTFRYRGHRHIVNFLLNHMQVEPEEFKKIIINNSNKTNSDRVIIAVYCGNKDGYSTYWLPIDNTEDFSAMQIATAAPAAVVSKMFFEGKLEKPSYSCIADHFDEFSSHLSQIAFDVGAKDVT